MSKIDSKALRRFVSVFRQFFTSNVRRPALGWSLMLLVVILAINGLNVLNSYVGRDFMTAVEKRNRHDYFYYAVLYFGVFVGLTIVAVLSRFAEERLRLLWRAWVTEHLIERYLDNRAYYRLMAREEVDNPDQRLTEDVKSYTQTTLSFFLLWTNASITSIAFLSVLWSITPILVLVALGYAAIGTVATILLGRSLVPLDNAQLKKEADLRYELIQLRESSSSVAVMGVERVVRRRLLERLQEVVQNNKIIIAVTRNLGFLVIGYNYLIQLVPILIVAPLYMRGQVEFGVITQSAMAFAQVLGALSLIVTQFETLSSFAAVTNRLNTIMDSIEEARVPSPTAIVVNGAEERIKFDGLTLWTAKQKTVLVRNLSLTLERGQNLLVVGPNTVAKCALFTAAAGIWEDGEGHIVLPPHDEVLFVPHEPFVDHGNLRGQLIIRANESSMGDGPILDALEKAGLKEIVDRLGGLDAEHDWPKTLSMGEQHLLSLARILLARPRFVFLERMDDGLEAKQLEQIHASLTESSITYIAIASGPRRTAFPGQILEIEDDGTWQIRSS